MTTDEAKVELAIAQEQADRAQLADAESRQQGGPAFPQPCTEGGHACNNWYGIAGGGMSMRDYFAAHAPVDPANWFIPKPGEPPPSLPEGAEYCDGCKGDADCEKTAACLKMQDYRENYEGWKQNNKRRVFVAWRWAYADAMIAGQQTP